MDILQDLLPKIDQLNNVGDNEIKPYREQTFRERTGLTQKDFRDLGRWTMSRTQVTLDQLQKEMERLKTHTMASYHIFSAPLTFVHPSNRNEESVKLLCQEVPYADMQPSNTSGQIWKKCKDGTLDTPGWEKF